jgi:peptide chain release factor
MILLQFSAAQGPDECCLAVTKAVRYFLQEALQAGVKTDIVEQEYGNQSGTFRSVLLSFRPPELRNFTLIPIQRLIGVLNEETPFQ